MVKVTGCRGTAEEEWSSADLAASGPGEGESEALSVGGSYVNKGIAEP